MGSGEIGKIWEIGEITRVNTLGGTPGKLGNRVNMEKLAGYSVSQATPLVGNGEIGGNEMCHSVSQPVSRFPHPQSKDTTSLTIDNQDPIVL